MQPQKKKNKRERQFMVKICYMEENQQLLCKEFIGKLTTGFEINVIIVSFDRGYILGNMELTVSQQYWREQWLIQNIYNYWFYNCSQ